MPNWQIPYLLTEATTEVMNADFEIMRINRARQLREPPPTSGQMADFQQAYNEFINHRKRPYVAFLEHDMKL